MKNIYIYCFIALGFLSKTQAQQDPHYTQYMYNMSVVNPAYAGSKEALATGLLYRKQWVEIEDAPTTATVFGHAPVGKNLGMGLSVVSDKIGPVSETNVYGDFSYTLKLGENRNLAFGLKAGVSFHNVDLYTRIASTLPNPADGAFGSDVSNKYFNLGTGFFYYTNKYYLAASIPNMLRAKHLDYNGRSYGNESNHYFVTGGYVFDINSDFKFKPHFMMKSAFETPFSFDLSANVLMYDKFEAGATYRLNDSFGAMVNYAVTPDLKIGYAYDLTISRLRLATSSTHEIILLYDVNFSKKVSRSPRFF
jgi:type IX secretion system PorP/SprF family membrane protein